MINEDTARLSMYIKHLEQEFDFFASVISRLSKANQDDVIDTERATKILSQINLRVDRELNSVIDKIDAWSQGKPFETPTQYYSDNSEEMEDEEEKNDD